MAIHFEFSISRAELERSITNAVSFGGSFPHDFCHTLDDL